MRLARSRGLWRVLPTRDRGGMQVRPPRSDRGLPRSPGRRSARRLCARSGLAADGSCRVKRSHLPASAVGVCTHWPSDQPAARASAGAGVLEPSLGLARAAMDRHAPVAGNARVKQESAHGAWPPFGGPHGWVDARYAGWIERPLRVRQAAAQPGVGWPPSTSRPPVLALAGSDRDGHPVLAWRQWAAPLRVVAARRLVREVEVE